MKIKTRKNGNILNINIDGKIYYAWFWTPSCIYVDKRKELIKNKQFKFQPLH